MYDLSQYVQKVKFEKLQFYSVHSYKNSRYAAELQAIISIIIYMHVVLFLQTQNIQSNLLELDTSLIRGFNVRNERIRSDKSSSRSMHRRTEGGQAPLSEDWTKIF